MNRIKGVFVLIGGLLWSIVQYPFAKLKQFDQWCLDGPANRTLIFFGLIFVTTLLITWARGVGYG